MTRTILVPLDGSELAEHVLPHAISLARTYACHIHLLRVVPMVHVPAVAWPMVADIDQHTIDVAIDQAKDYLKDVAKRLEASQIRVSCDVVNGEPAQAILAFIKTHPEMYALAMTTHGRSGIKRWLLGSVAEKLVQATELPMLVVRAGIDVEPVSARYQHILVPLDGSVFAEQALPVAQDLADWYGANLELFIVAEPVEEMMLMNEYAYAHGEWSAPELDNHLREKAEIYLGQRSDILQQQGFRVETQVRVGLPADEIIRHAEVSDVDLIVMATHGRNGLQRLWLGSVAARVIRTSPCPVLLVHQKTSNGNGNSNGVG